MVVSLSLLVGAYLTSILSFSFVSSPIHYCLLLLVSSFSACGFIFSVAGFSWYVVLFCLVYVGGVYILFIFVSVYSPNSGFASALSWWGLFVFFAGVSAFFGLVGYVVPMWGERSHYLCSGVEGFSYSLFCLVLLIGFACVSVVVNRKDSFYR